MQLAKITTKIALNYVTTYRIHFIGNVNANYLPKINNKDKTDFTKKRAYKKCIYSKMTSGMAATNMTATYTKLVELLKMPQLAARLSNLKAFHLWLPQIQLF